MGTTQSTAITALHLSMAAETDPAALPPGWKLTTWGVGDQGGNRALLAVRAGTEEYAVAIRGTLVSFTLGALTGWLSDFDACVDRDPAIPSDCGAPREPGMSGVRNLMMMRGRHGKTLPEHLIATLPRGSTLLVTGHGVGGCVAVAFARWIAAWLPGVSVTACVADRGWIRKPVELPALRG